MLSQQLAKSEARNKELLYDNSIMADEIRN